MLVHKKRTVLLWKVQCYHIDFNDPCTENIEALCFAILMFCLNNRETLCTVLEGLESLVLKSWFRINAMMQLVTRSLAPSFGKCLSIFSDLYVCMYVCLLDTMYSMSIGLHCRTCFDLT